MTLIRLSQHCRTGLAERITAWLGQRTLLYVQYADSAAAAGSVLCVADSGDTLSLGPLPRGSTLEGLALQVAKIVGATHIDKWHPTSAQTSVWRCALVYGADNKIRRDLVRLSQQVWGDDWQSPLSRALNVNDRTVRRWVAGQVIPASAVDDLRMWIKAEADRLSALAAPPI